MPLPSPLLAPTGAQGVKMSVLPTSIESSRKSSRESPGERVQEKDIRRESSRKRD